MSTIVLSDHNSFVSFFRKFAAGEITNDVVIKFEQSRREKEIPFLHVQGDDYNGTINATVMEALLVYQKNINTLYSLVTYGRVKKLNASEIEAMKVIFEVQDGSSNFKYINFDGILNDIISNSVDLEATFILVVGILLFFSKFGMDYYLANKNTQESQLNRDLISDERQKDRDFISEQSQLDRYERQKDRDFNLKIIEQTEEGQKLIKDNNKFSGKLKKLSKNADIVKYSGHTILATPETKDKRVIANKAFNGNYRILRLDAQRDDFFEVKIENVDTGDKFNARLDDLIRQEDVKLEIYKAIFSRKEVDLKINASFVDKKVISAWITSVEGIGITVEAK